MRKNVRDEGFSLIEAMIAMVISGIALMGVMGAVEVSIRSIQQAGLSSRAMELAHSRLEAKRSVHWKLLLDDDLDDDGIAETSMRDDGQGHDAAANDGVYTAVLERDGVTVVWTVEVDRPGPLGSVGMAAIQAVAFYQGPDNQKEVRLATLRANPAFVGRL
ncbi:MAG TPA: type II secretion system protein [Nitrospira sp.]|nr:type II secretion system protein [Nitrospira sp.]